MSDTTAPDPADASSPVLVVERGAGFVVLTLNRPDAMNAFNQELWLAVTDALVAAATDDDVRCVLITGTGRAFSAGQDLGEMMDPSVFEGTEPGYEVLIPVLEAFPKPLLAAVNGVGVGIGLTMLLHCDIALISTEARLKVPFISLGVTTEASASYLLPATIGWQRAAEVLFCEPWLDADAAVECGLALRAVAPGDLMAEAVALATHIGSLPLAPLRTTKELMLAARLDAVRAARSRETAAFRDLVGAMMAGESTE